LSNVQLHLVMPSITVISSMIIPSDFVNEYAMLARINIFLRKTKQNKQTSETHNTLNKRRSVLLPTSSSDNEIAPLQISSRLQFGVNISFNRDCRSVLVPRSYIYLAFLIDEPR